MKQNAKKLLKIGKFVTIIVIWTIVFISCYKGYILWDRFQEYPQSEFYTSNNMDDIDLDFELNQDSNARDSEQKDLDIKLHMIDDAILWVRIGVLFLFVFIVIDYFYEPKDHFFTWIRNKVSGFKYEIEEDEDEQEGTDKKD